MAATKKEIMICMGSSCFSRGNRGSLPMIQKYLREHGLEGEVILKGNHCFSNCSEGPVLKIGGKIYTRVTGERIPGIMENEFGASKPAEDGTPSDNQQ